MIDNSKFIEILLKYFILLLIIIYINYVMPTNIDKIKRSVFIGLFIIMIILIIDILLKI
mgnify:CR=1 FL=1|jgi:hypothetical protein